MKNFKCGKLIWTLNQENNPRYTCTAVYVQPIARNRGAKVRFALYIAPRFFPSIKENQL